MARIKKLNFVVSENISAAKSRRWFTQERAASLARLTIVIGLHVLVLAGLFSWSWSPTPIEVSILTLQDLEGDTPKTEDSQVQEPVQPSIAATQVPSAESIETEQIDIALTQQSQPEPESAVQSRLEAPPESRPFTETGSTRCDPTTNGDRCRRSSEFNSERTTRFRCRTGIHGGAFRC